MTILPNHSSRSLTLLVIIRLILLVIMLAGIGIFIAGIFEFHQFANSHPVEFIPYAPPWTPQVVNNILGQVGLSLSNYLQFKLATSILSALVFWSTGFLIFFRKGSDWFGMFIGALFVLFGTVSGDPGTAFSGNHPGLNAILLPIATSVWLGLLMLLFLFPDGRFIPSWTRWIALLVLLLDVVENISGVLYGANASPLFVLATLSLWGIGIGSQIYRYRRMSNPVQRQQAKWVMFGLVISFVFLILSVVPSLMPDLITPGAPANLLALVLSALPNIFLAVIPLSVAFAILRYRLWDIDLIIRRTLIYAALTATLGLVYFGSVVLLEQILGGLAGESSISIVISTLLIAALFTPLRRRVQGFIDRRFYRQKYDAARAFESFSTTARNQVEFEHLSRQLVNVVEKTIQPEKISLWLSIRKETTRRSE